MLEAALPAQLGAHGAEAPSSAHPTPSAVLAPTITGEVFCTAPEMMLQLL